MYRNGHRQLLVALCLTILFSTSCGKRNDSSTLTDGQAEPFMPSFEGLPDAELDAWINAQAPSADTSCDVPTKAPGVMDLIRKSRPEGLESLDFYQSLMRYGEDDRQKLIDRFVVAEDSPPEIEVVPLPYEQAKRRREESIRYFGDGHETSVYWQVQERRSAYENGLATRGEIQVELTNAASKVAGASPGFSTYLEIRCDQWRQEDSRTPLPYAVDGRLHLAAQSDSLWSARTLAAFADGLRFLDRHGLVCTARISATQFRKLNRQNSPKASAIAWLLLCYFAELDVDWSFAFAGADQALGTVSRSGIPYLIRSLSLNPHFDIACAKNRFDIPLRPDSDRTFAALLLKSSPGARARVIERLTAQERPITTSEMSLILVLLDQPTVAILRSNERVIRRLLSVATERDKNDWIAVSIVQELSRFYVPSSPKDLQSSLMLALADSFPICMSRFRKLATCTSHDRIMNVGIMISRSLAFQLSTKTDLLEPEILQLYRSHLDLKELESRVMRNTISDARLSLEGQEYLIHLSNIHNVLSQFFWTSSYNVANLQRNQLPKLVVERSLSMEAFLQQFAQEIDSSVSTGWLSNIPDNTVVFDFAQWIDFSTNAPEPKLAAFIVYRNRNESITARLVKLELTITAANIKSLAFERRGDLRVIGVEPAIKRQTLANSISRLCEEVSKTCSKLVLVLESSTAELPWTQAILFELTRRNVNVREISVCFHSSQLVEKTDVSESIQQIDFVSNHDYAGFRSKFADFPYEVPDLNEVPIEENLIRDVAGRLNVSMQTHKIDFPARDYTNNTAVHFAGHATSVNLRSLMQTPPPVEPQLLRLRKEMNIWCRTPYVASTLLLATVSHRPGMEPTLSFMTAGSIRFLPFSPPGTVVLSTCNSIGGHSLPTKAPAGLAKAFWIWGVDNIIASSDSIPDDNPGEFLPQVYEKAVQGEPLSEAFFSAYREALLDDERPMARVNWNFYGL